MSRAACKIIICSAGVEAGIVGFREIVASRQAEGKPLTDAEIGGDVIPALDAAEDALKELNERLLGHYGYEKVAK